MKRSIWLSKRVTSSILAMAAVMLLTTTSCKKDKDDDEDDDGASVNYSGTMVKSADNVPTQATGNVTAVFHTGSRKLDFTVNWNNLTSNAGDMHFHDGTPPNAPIIIDIEGFTQTTSGTVSGTVTLTSEQATDLGAGKIFVQVHSLNFPGGEIVAVLTVPGGNPGGGDPGGGNPGGGNPGGGNPGGGY